MPNSNFVHQRAEMLRSSADRIQSRLDADAYRGTEVRAPDALPSTKATVQKENKVRYLLAQLDPACWRPRPIYIGSETMAYAAERGWVVSQCRHGQTVYRLSPDGALMPQVGNA